MPSDLQTTDSSDSQSESEGSTDSQRESTEGGIQFTDTNDIALVDGEDNAKQQLAFTAKAVVRERTPIRTRTDRQRLVAALRDSLRENPHADRVGEIRVERNDDEITVTIQIGSDEITI